MGAVHHRRVGAHHGERLALEHEARALDLDELRSCRDGQQDQREHDQEPHPVFLTPIALCGDVVICGQDAHL